MRSGMRFTQSVTRLNQDCASPDLISMTKENSDFIQKFKPTTVTKNSIFTENQTAMKKIFLLFFLICALFSGSLLGQSKIDKQWLEPKLDSIVQLGIDSMAYPGAQVVVRQGGEIVLSKSYGHHTYDGSKTVKSDHLYDLASVTKVSTGLAILMKLHGEGLINLDDTWGGVYENMKSSNKSNLKLIDILSHRAGLQPYIVFWQEAQCKKHKWKWRSFCDHQSRRYPILITDSLYLYKNYNRKMLKQIKETPLTPEGEYHYSGLFFLTLPDLIEKMTGGNYEQMLYDEIYEPIGIKNLMYNPLRKDRHISVITPTEKDILFRHKLVHGTVHDEAAAMLDGVSCNAGLFGNAEDLSLLFQLYLNKGNWDGKQILPKISVEEFTAYHFVEEENHRGLGFDKPLINYDADRSYCAESASPESFGHSGFTGTFVWADPKYDLVFVFLSNRVYPTRENRKLYSLSLRPQMHQLVYNSLR